MVKGLSRRAVLVRFPETGLFEEAVFVVREDRLSARGVSAEQVISEACQIAQNHHPKTRAARKRAGLWPPAVYTALGAIAVGAVWALSVIFG